MFDLQRIVIVLHGWGTPVIFTILPKWMLMPGTRSTHLDSITVGGRDLLNKVCKTKFGREQTIDRGNRGALSARHGGQMHFACTRLRLVSEFSACAFGIT